MIDNIESFIKYFKGIRRRTVVFAKAIPADKIEWSSQEGEFTCGDILRHLVALEKITVGVMKDNKWPVYPGHDDSLASGLDEIINYMEVSHQESMKQLGRIDDSVLLQERPAIGGQPVKSWRLLMAMTEHEIHHRSQLATYLQLMGVEPPHLFGLGVEDVVSYTNEQR